MEQLLEFIGNHPILTGAFAVALAAIIATESARLLRRWKELDTAYAIRLINREDPLILDVSNSADYAKSHILNAEHMPPSKIEAGNQRLLKQAGRPVLVYCKTGQVSPQMATRLTKLGFDQVYVLRGGLNQWISDGQPTSRAKGAGKKSAPRDKESGAKVEKSSRRQARRQHRKENRAKEPEAVSEDVSEQQSDGQHPESRRSAD